MNPHVARPNASLTLLAAASCVTTLSEEINTKTRGQHAQLNRLIIERLPLALPPLAQDPSTLGHGLARFAEVFFAFEDAWERVEDQQDIAGRSDHEIQIRSWLQYLRPDGLPRSQRLRADLSHIEKVADQQLFLQSDPILRSRLLKIVRTKPHVLVAYAWVMYMATFSGGRWIRKQLYDAGETFWTPHGDKADSDGMPYVTAGYDCSSISFLCFDGTEDGEDIKRAFKARLAYAEELFTVAERREVIDEAQYIFQHCIKLVHDLDRSIGQLVVLKTFASKRIMFVLCLLAYILWLSQGTFLEKGSYRAFAIYMQRLSLEPRGQAC